MCKKKLIISVSSFNSRTREGATFGLPIKKVPTPVSIHAPVRVRQLPPLVLVLVTSFNSRTREGATTTGDFSNLNRGVSIHAPVRVRHWC